MTLAPLIATFSYPGTPWMNEGGPWTSSRPLFTLRNPRKCGFLVKKKLDFLIFRDQQNYQKIFFAIINEYPGQDLVSQRPSAERLCSSGHHTLATGNHPGALINGFFIPWHLWGEWRRSKDFIKVSISSKKPKEIRVFGQKKFGFFNFSRSAKGAKKFFAQHNQLPRQNIACGRAIAERLSPGQGSQLSWKFC